MTRAMKYCITAALLLQMGCGGGDGVSGAPAPVDTLMLTVHASLGAATGDSTAVFGSIADACRDPRGNVLVLDQVARGVKVYSPEGEFIRQIGREGGGPGELQMPLYVTCRNDGLVMVHDPMSNAFVTYDSSGTFMGNVSLWDNGPPIQAVAVGDSGYAGILLEFDMTGDRPLMTRSIILYDSSGEFVRVYHSDQLPVDFSDFTGVLRSMIFSFAIAGDGDGRVFYSPVSSEAYEIHGFEPGGLAFLSLERDLPRVRKTREEMQDEEAYIESWASRIGMQGVPIDWEPDPYRNFVRALGVDDSERIWVARGTGGEPFFDVFDMGGEHLFSARLPLSGNSWMFHTERRGILCWDEDPPEGYQQLHLVGYPRSGTSGGQ